MVQYSPLDPQKSEIRLVTLLPGKSHDAIRCTLSTASLDSAPEFTALSYAWGDPSKTKQIIVDSEPFDVTVNLELGLRTIRKRWGRRVLWIDAICINQKDDQEKNVQVPEMGRLYSTAPSVLAWLGPSSTNIKLFVSWMRTHATKSYDTASAVWLTLDARSALSKSAKLERDWAVIRAYEGYYEFLALSYWGRVWTFQEYLLPRTPPICVCGNIQPFQLTTVLGELGTDGLAELRNQAVKDLMAEYSSKMDVGGLDMLNEALGSPRMQILFAVSRSAWALPDLRDRQVQELSMFLFFTSDRQCFDERDKIFALYGLLPAAQEIYPPDYTKPITEVMLQAAAYIVNFEHGSHFLWPQFALRDERLADSSRLYPSWMPDFSGHMSLRNSNVHVDINGPVAIPLTRSQDMLRPVSVEHTTLRLWARYLGTCRVAVQFADTKSNVLEQIHGLLQMDVLEHDIGQTARKSENLIPRIARLCVAHRSLLSDFSAEEILETFSSVFDSDPDAQQNSSHGPFWDIIKSAAEVLTGKALLVTNNGCLGICVGGVKDGDVVVIPPEVKVPLVLTPKSSTSADGVEYHKMVGTAIIDGVMSKGELFDEELVEEIAKRDVVEFLVH